MGRHSAPTGRNRPDTPPPTVADFLPAPPDVAPLTDEFPLTVQFVDNVAQFVPEDVDPADTGPHHFTGLSSVALASVMAAGLIVHPLTGEQPAQAAERAQKDEILSGLNLEPVSTERLSERLGQLSTSRQLREAEQAHAAEVQAAADAAELARRAEVERQRIEAVRVAEAKAKAERAAEQARQAAQETQEATENSSRPSGTPSASPSAPGPSVGGQLVAGARLTSGVGARWGTNHNGVDLAAPLGTPIQAAASGRVLMAGAASGYGNWIVVLTNDGFVNIYGHMRTLYVSAGDSVLAGERIALVGNEGQSTGPHLHFEVRSGGSLKGAVVNPVGWLAARGIRV